MSPKDVAERGSGCEIRTLPRDTTDSRDAEGIELPAGQRKRARRLGAILWLVVALIVAGAFAWKLSQAR